MVGGSQVQQGAVAKVTRQTDDRFGGHDLGSFRFSDRADQRDVEQPAGLSLARVLLGIVQYAAHPKVLGASTSTASAMLAAYVVTRTTSASSADRGRMMRSTNPGGGLAKVTGRLRRLSELT
jgi:hypothetical protein